MPCWKIAKSPSTFAMAILPHYAIDIIFQLRNLLASLAMARMLQILFVSYLKYTLLLLQHSCIQVFIVAIFKDAIIKPLIGSLQSSFAYNIIIISMVSACF